MVSLNVIFWMYLILFAVIGAMRGWAKELMVTFSVVLALFLITVLQTYVPIIRNTLVAMGGTSLFWFRTAIVLLLVFFGYQTPNIRTLAGARFARERLQDTLLGFMIGALNGFLVIGSLWWFMHNAGYPYANIVTPPIPGSSAGDAALSLIEKMPPEWLTIPWIYLAVGIAFVFVIIVFV